MEAKYLPFRERQVDTQYKDCLRKIKEEGIYTKNPFQTEGTFTSFTLPKMQFKFENGFPILTERNISFWRKPIGELLAFIHGVRDARVLADEWGVNWWRDKWATPEKCADFGLEPYDMGPGSYGPGFNRTIFKWETVQGHTDGGRWNPEEFNQIDHLIRQIKKYPGLRTHKVTTWIPEYCLQHDELRRQVVVAPCHGDIEIKIFDNKLYYRMDQRSADFPIGIPSNMIQHAAFALAIASVTGYEPYMFIHDTHDAQIYERHMNDVDELISRESMIFPTMHLTQEGKNLTNIFDFRPKHFELRDYVSQSSMTLADAVI